jgi:hypothetical protein
MLVSLTAGLLELNNVHLFSGQICYILLCHLDMKKQ